MDQPGYDGAYRFDLDEPGFRGELRIEERPDGRHVVLMGTRPDGSETAVEKDVPADRDARLLEQVERCIAGDPTAAADVAAHLGVLDPE